MFKPLSLFVGLRYTRSRRRNHFISFISGFSALGIALGVIALITVLSVMNGFHKEIQTRILGMASHGDIKGYEGNLTDWQLALQKAKEHPRVLAAAPYIEAQAMLNSGGDVSGAMVRGVNPALEKDVIDVADHMKFGSFDDLATTRWGIILGAELAAKLGVSIGSELTMVVPQMTVTIAGSVPRMKAFTVVGIFEVGMNEYDRGVALIHLPDASKLLRMKDDVSGVRIRIDDVWDAREVSLELANALPGRYRVLNWTDYHRNFFAALKMEKRMMGLLLFLVVVIAAFNIISTLVMMVVDKQADIAILKTFGASPGFILRVFVVQGAALGFFGTLVGTFLGVSLAANVDSAVAWVEQVFDLHFIDPNVYYISQLPSDVQLPDVLLVSIGSFLLSLLMTLYPAWKAYKTQPAEALRYE